MTHKNETIQTGWHLENSYADLPVRFFRKLSADPVKAPRLIILNRELAEQLGLDPETLESEEGAEIFAGNRFPEGAKPLAQAYAGHQFGQFTMLGDGRALLLGEQITPDGKRVDIQLKGSGRTPYSRGGDGRAALGPMLREYVISEAMHGLGIPTTRSLAVTATGERIMRETGLPGAVLTRTAASHLRVGTFQYAAQWGTREELQRLADYAIDRHYPEVKKEKNPYLALFREVAKRQAALIAKWQLVGFIHGVMNTDNMTISGETIDYGPCAFMDTYDPKTVFSSIDVYGRYAYGNQPQIGGWNLARFAESLLPLIDEQQEKAVELAQNELASYIDQYQTHYLDGMRAKLGLFREEPEDDALIEDLLKLLHEHEADYTNTFRSLTLGHLDSLDLFETEAFRHWRTRWQARLDSQSETEEEARALMRRSNPSVIPRNHRVEEALQTAEDTRDLTVMNKLLAVLKDPYAYSPEQEAYTEPAGPSDWPYQTFCGT